MGGSVPKPSMSSDLVMLDLCYCRHTPRGWCSKSHVLKSEGLPKTDQGNLIDLEKVKKKEKERAQQPSHPSVKGQQAAPGALDGRAHWESQEANPVHERYMNHLVPVNLWSQTCIRHQC